ncbi:hypothetical protein [Streptomyces phytophilus]|uniref:hypothetical protein n=1 Tax=Streptomyces phytophilus TaxID=722715 RepID=UPI0015F02EE0|nr:hypothetical protein [Streptomyces phytophilus]
MGRRGLRRGVAALCAGAALLGAAGCSSGPDGWREGDVRPETAEEACSGVSADTLALLRIAPARGEVCHWASDRASGTGQTLTVGVRAYTPDREDDVTAAQAAASDFPPDDVRRLGAGAAESLRKVPGLGDGAVTYRGGPTTHKLLVRQRNVVVRVEAGTANRFDDAATVPPAAADAAVLAAARDVLDAAGVPLDDGGLPEPPEPAAGDVRQAKPLCEALRAQGARLMPGTEPSAESPAGDQIRRCHWRGDGDDPGSRLFVEAAAFAPSALRGRGGEAEAVYALDQVAFGSEPLDGLGGKALVHTETDDTNLYVRKGNLLVRVWYVSPGPAPDRRAAAESVARTVLAQYE